MSGEVHTQLLSCGDTNEVGSYVPCSHLRDAECGRYVVGGSRVLDYGRASPYSRTTSGEVCRGKTTSGQVRVSIMNPKSVANLVM